MRRTVTNPAGRRTLDTEVPPAVAARRRPMIGRRRVDAAGAPVLVEGRSAPRRTRRGTVGEGGAGAGFASGAGNGLLLLARLVRFVTGVLVTLIVAAILLRVLAANPGNEIVRNVHDIARSLVGPFDGLFNLKNAKVEIAVNWGLAALAYLAVGSFIAGLLARAGLAGARGDRV